MKNLFNSEICVDCGLACRIGSSRFINRYPVYSDEVEGYRCGDCAAEVDALCEELQAQLILGFFLFFIFYYSWSYYPQRNFK